MSVRHSEDHLLAHARWWTQRKRRWPLQLGLAAGVWIGIFAFSAGYGRMLALKRLPQSEAAFLALAPAAVPDDENAAPLWDQAGAAQVRWPGQFSDSPESNSFDWSNAAHYAAGSPLRMYLSSNASALALAGQAAVLPRAKWPLNYKSGFAIALPHLGKLRNLSRLLRQAALVDAHDGDWNSARERFKATFAAARHVRTDPLLICNLIATVIDRIALDKMHLAVSVSHSAVTLQAVTDFEALLREQLALPGGLDRAVAGEAKMGLWTMDQIAARSGNLPALGINALSATAYGAIYPYDRVLYQWNMERLDQALRNAAGGPPEKLDLSARAGVFNTMTFSRMLLPTMERTIENGTNRTLRFRLTLAELAVLRYRLTHGGAWPETLAAAGLALEFRVDPWSAERNELLYKLQTEGGATVWSERRNQEHWDTERKNFELVIPPTAGAPRP